MTERTSRGFFIVRQTPLDGERRWSGPWSTSERAKEVMNAAQKKTDDPLRVVEMFTWPSDEPWNPYQKMMLEDVA